MLTSLSTMMMLILFEVQTLCPGQVTLDQAYTKAQKNHWVYSDQYIDRAMPNMIADSKRLARELCKKD